MCHPFFICNCLAQGGNYTNDQIVANFNVITTFKCKSNIMLHENIDNLIHIYAAILFIQERYICAKFRKADQLYMYLLLHLMFQLSQINIFYLWVLKTMENSIAITYFFKPYIHPAKSFVILPESTVATHAFSNVVANL